MIGKLAYLMLALGLGYVIVGPGFLAGVAVGALTAFRAGQYARGYAHARGIRRSHWHAIGGGHR